MQRLERELSEAKQDVVDLSGQLDDSGRHNRYLRGQLREANPAAYSEPAPSEFRPSFCSEVVEYAASSLHRLVIHPSVIEGAEALDEHADESWARKAWLAFTALQAYAEAKAVGSFEGDFRTCCEQSAVETIVPASWVARTESQHTMANDRFRDSRNLRYRRT